MNGSDSRKILLNITQSYSYGGGKSFNAEFRRNAASQALSQMTAVKPLNLKVFM